MSASQVSNTGWVNVVAVAGLLDLRFTAYQGIMASVGGNVL